MKKINTENLPPTSIVIITLNEEKRIPRLLEELSRQTYQDFQLIISDSNSTDNTEEVVKKHGNVGKETLFHQCGVTNGPARGRNRGVEQTKHEIIFFFDADTQLGNEQFLSKAVGTFIQKNLDSASIYIKPSKSNIQYTLGTWFSNILYTIFQHTSLPLAVGGGMMAKKSVHNTIGGFDESITLGEDSEYAQRVKKHGFTFGFLPQRFIFDIRRVEQHGARNTSFTYLKTLFHLMQGGDFPRKTDKKQVNYTFDQYSN